MKNSELIKQLKSLKESVKTASRQAEMDKRVYERMQNIAGIINETEYVEEDEKDPLIGKKFFQQKQGSSMSGRGTITTWWKVLREKKPGIYECEVVDEGEKRSRGAVSKKDFTKEYIQQNLERSL